MADPLLVLRRALDVHRRLSAAGIENAVGGALCLGFHVDDPRGTQDIDLNVALPADRALEALQALPPDVPWDDETVATILRDDQVRIRWPVDDGLAMPLDLFFAVAPFHDLAAERAVTVPLLDGELKVLTATDLAVFKALFDRTKDWADIEAMAAAHDATIDLDEAARWVGEIVGTDDPRVSRLRGLVRFA